MNMSLAEMQSISRKQFQEEQQGGEDVTETTPPKITPEITAFVKSLNANVAQYLPVLADPHGLYRFCSDGVFEKIKHDGGRCVYGWSIWEWPNVMLTSEFHAVWEDSSGTCFDITPKPKNESRILFAADCAYEQDFDFDNRPRNGRTRIYRGVDPVNVAAEVKAKLNGGKLAYEEKRAAKAGVCLDDWLISKVPADTLAENIDQLIAACNEFDEHFDSLGVAGTVMMDDKFKELVLRRVQLQDRLKRQLKAKN